VECLAANDDLEVYPMGNALDFSRSFATFVTPGRTNHARIQVEAICDLADGERYLLVASCKAEDTYAESDLFKQPNYDFCGIFGMDQEGRPTDYCLVRVGLPLTACWRDVGIAEERFEELRIDLAEVEAELCADKASTVEATLQNRPLVGCTEVLDEAGEVLAQLQYPIKTMNVNDPDHSPDGDWIYQVDTGPIIVPDPARQAELTVEQFDLAFIAWHSAGWADLIALEPTQVNHSDDCAGHYSRVSTVKARNEVLALG
jgi:hypothetical protein